MSLLSLFGISSAYAASAGGADGAAHHGGFMSMLPMLIIFIVAFYFLLIRPQSKRAKAQRKLLGELTVGDEVLTNGGIIGRITKLRDNFVSIVTGAQSQEMMMQKNAIVSVLPKGTMESMH